MTNAQGEAAMQAAVDSGNVRASDAYVSNWQGAANAMWSSTGQPGNFSYDPQGQYQITARDADGDGEADHFVNNIGDGQYRDPLNGNVGDLNTLPTQVDNTTRGFNYNNYNN